MDVKRKSGVSGGNQLIKSQKPDDSPTIDIDALPFNSQTKKGIAILFGNFNDGSVFSRKDIRELCDLTDSPAGDLLNRMKKASLIIEVKGQGKYRFIADKK